MGTETGIVTDLSPSTQAVVFGPGRVWLRSGREIWYIGEREAYKLVTAWLSFDNERRRRAGLQPVEVPGYVRAAETASTDEPA